MIQFLIYPKEIVLFYRHQVKGSVVCSTTLGQLEAVGLELVFPENEPEG